MELFALKKKELSTVTGLLTSHCSLKYYLCRIDKVKINVCRLCCCANDRMEHLEAH